MMVALEDLNLMVHTIMVLVVVVLVQQVLTNLTIHSQDHLVVMEKELVSLDQDILLELLDHHLLVALVVVIALL